MDIDVCPFCGSAALIYEIPAHRHFFCDMPDFIGGAFIECTNCGAGISANNVEEALAKWNRRYNNGRS